MNTIPLKKHSNVFINCVTGDTIFTVKDGKDILLPTNSDNQKSRVSIKGEVYNTLPILLEALNIEFGESDRITYNITKGGFISPASIKIKKAPDCTDQDKFLIFQYRCDVKANSANSRFKDKISPSTILQVLKISNFTCIYCNDNLDADSWQLDHYHAKAYGGKNTLDNLAPSCIKCNQMKGAMDGIHFLKRCFKICSQNKMLTKQSVTRFTKALKEMNNG